MCWRSTAKFLAARSWGALLLCLASIALLALSGIEERLNAQSGGTQQPTVQVPQPIRPDTFLREWQTATAPANDFLPQKNGTNPNGSFSVSLAPKAPNA